MEMGTNGSLATTRLSNLRENGCSGVRWRKGDERGVPHMELKSESRAVNATPIANMDFIFTSDRSLL